MAFLYKPQVLFVFAFALVGYTTLALKPGLAEFAGACQIIAN